MKRIFTKICVLASICLLFFNVSFAQNVTVKGVVRDASDKTTLPSVSVSVKGTTTGTQTDVNGAYSIAAPANATLVFTYIGYNSQELQVAGKTILNVALESTSKELQQVVVIGYGTQKKRDVTGSITSVKGTEIEKFAVTNPVAALQGKVPGLTISNAGNPGSSPTVRIRGINSTGASNDPLYVVDGIFQTNIDYLNPADIETIDLLRDASSIAIFGLKGANGVIAITTKRAAKGKTTVNFQSTFGIQHVTNLIDVVDADGFKKLYSAQLANLNAAPFDYTNYTANTNWQNQIIRDAVINTNTLSISNSGEKSTTLLNVGYNNQDGVLKNNNFKKFVARLSEEIRITDNIKVGGDLTGYHFINTPTSADLNNALWAAPIIPIQTDANTYYSLPTFQRAQVLNPVARLNRGAGTAIDAGFRFTGSVYAEIKFLKDFTLRSSFSTDLGFNNARRYTPLPYSFINLGEGTNPTNTYFDNTAKTSVEQQADENRKYQQDQTLTYNKVFDGGHTLTALLGFSSYSFNTTNLKGSRRDTTLNVPFDSDLWYIGAINTNNPTFNDGSGSTETNLGAFGRINYSYKNRYLLNATIRRDGNSRFAPANRWGTFGSVGLGWVASDEDFFKNNIKGVDFFKLRASYGYLGNANSLTDNVYQVGLNGGATAVFGQNVYTAVSPAYTADPNLQYEVVKGFDLGLEARALNNRLSLDLGVYDKTTSKIISNIILPGTNLGYITNLGDISNRGIEVSLGWNDKIGSDFSYGINGNFSYVKNKVKSLGLTNFKLLGNGGVNVTETGNPIGYFYGYRQTGIYQTTADLDKEAHFANSLPGDISYQDVNGDGVITPADRTYLGTPFPPYSYGLSLSLGYKGFDAVVEGQGVAGNKIYTQRRTSNFAILNYETNRLNAWTAAGSTNVEPILDNSRGNNLLFSSYYLESGSYFRLRNVQLGYTFAKNMLSEVGIQKLRVFVSGQNVKTWSKTTGYSPEAQVGTVQAGGVLAAGADNGVYPVPAIYSFGLNVTF
ncbi:TonB-linked SusC/RagA family outer membrane protein [Pedobacter sp. UYP30]|uniref:SusC/RagA family TonB-linked outer membrane protein n=1 Tax=Pedobacter sp. UYP30 TaxID=1756400 RepID=UPI0033980A47